MFNKLSYQTIVLKSLVSCSGKCRLKNLQKSNASTLLVDKSHLEFYSAPYSPVFGNLRSRTLYYVNTGKFGPEKNSIFERLLQSGYISNVLKHDT